MSERRPIPFYSGKTTYGWKVVRIVTDRLYSAGAYGKDAVEYIVGKWVEPPPGCGPLALYLLQKDANLCPSYWWNYLDRTAPLIVLYLCEYQKSTKRSLWAIRNPLDDHSYYVRRQHIYRRTDLPEGTVLADKIRLIKREIIGGR